MNSEDLNFGENVNLNNIDLLEDLMDNNQNNNEENNNHPGGEEIL